VLPGLEIVSRSVLPLPLDVSDLSVQLAERYHTIPGVIFKALLDFNPRAAFVGEKLDHIALFSHTHKSLLAGLIK
jgi:hypothetical protein